MAPALPPSADDPSAHLWPAGLRIVIPQTCIFDMDGVLVDSGVWHRAAWAALLEELGAEPPRPDYWRLTIGRPSEEAIPLLLGRAVPGAPTFVADLARRGVPRAVGTSASSWDVDNILAGLGLRRHFAVVVTADDVSFGKPDPEVYVLAARRLHADPAGCIVFEDSLVGVEAARRAGMRAVGVTTAHSETELREAGAERTIADFEGLEWTSLAAG